MIRWLPSILYAGLIFYGSHQPSLFPPSYGFEDKLLHFAVYAGFGALVAFAVPRHRIRFAFLAALLYGFSDELHQFFVPGRQTEFLDWVADSVGGLTGGFLYEAIRARLAASRRHTEG